jgi:ATP/maltotriose-dependent transcriptional regulator MalT
MMKTASANLATDFIIWISADDQQFDIRIVHLKAVNNRHSRDKAILIHQQANNLMTENLSDLLESIPNDSPSLNDELKKQIVSLCNQFKGPTRNYGLTKREKEVLTLLVEGCTKREISKRLFVSYNTIGTHVCNIYHKLIVKTRGSAVAKAIKEQLLP